MFKSLSAFKKVNQCIVDRTRKRFTPQRFTNEIIRDVKMFSDFLRFVQTHDFYMTFVKPVDPPVALIFSIAHFNLTPRDNSNNSDNNDYILTQKNKYINKYFKKTKKMY
jgi:hypothetical protein